MRRVRKAWLLTVLLLLLLSVPGGACASAKVSLSQTSATLLKGKSLKLKLSGTKKKVKWSSSKRSVATVSAKGKVTAKKKGSATITAKVGKKKYRCKVKVLQPVTSVKLNKKSLTLDAGKRGALKATAGPSSASSRAVVWTSSNPGVVTVDGSGALYAVNGGTATVTATAADGSGKRASCKVTVKGTILQMKISRTSLSLQEGRFENLSVYDTAGSAVVWGSSDPSVATVCAGTVIGAGPGTAVIVAQKTDGSQSVSCTVTVSARVQRTAPTAAAQQFLSILQRYSDQVRQDKESKRGIWGYSNSSKLNPKTWTAAESAISTKKVTYNNCALLARIALREMGILGEGQNFWGTPEGGIHFNSGVAAKLKERCEIISVYATPNQLLAEGRLLPGDICTWTFDYNHTNVYAGNGLWYDAGRGGDGQYMSLDTVAQTYGIDKKNLKSDNGTSNMYVFNSFGPCATINMDRAVVGQIIRVIR